MTATLLSVRLKLVSCAGIIFALMLSTTATADLYWCQGKGKTRLSEIKQPGMECRLVQKDKSKAKSRENLEETSLAPRKTVQPRHETVVSAKEFPIIEDWEQGNRDEIRASILRQEFHRERATLAAIRQRLQERPAQTERNFLQRRRQIHIQNIKALQQEIARL